MDRCPVELWECIFEQACTDGGQTGGRLALVSRGVRNISAPYRYRSVALTSQAQLLAFARLCGLESRQKCRRPISAAPTPVMMIRYLFASPPECTAQNCVAWAVVLAVSAPSLQLLTVDNLSAGYVPDASLHCPHLTTLSVDSVDFVSDVNPVRAFPALRRLHIRDFRGTYSSADILRRWNTIAEHCPTTTHLALSGVHRFGLALQLETFVRSLRLPDTNAVKKVVDDNVASLGAHFDPLSYITSDSPAPIPPLHERRVLPALRHLYLRPTRLFEKWTELEDAVRKATKAQVDASQTQPAGRAGERSGWEGQLHALSSPLWFDVGMLRQEWLELIQGGDGFWSEC